MGLDEDFKETAAVVSQELNQALSDSDLIELYGLFKQGTVGDIDIECPGEDYDKVKWIAWNKKKGMDPEDAKQEYISFAKKMFAKYANNKKLKV